MSRIYTDINGEEVICVYTNHIDDGIIIEQILWSSPDGNTPKDILPLFIEDGDTMYAIEQEIAGHIEAENDEALIAEWMHQQEAEDYHDEI